MTATPTGTSRRLDPVHLIVWVALLIGVPLVLLLVGTLNALAWPEGRIAVQAAMAVTAGIGLLLAARDTRLVRSPVVAGGLAMVAATAVSAVGAQHSAAALEAVALIAVSAPCYLAIRALAWDEILTRRVRWLIVVIAFVALVPFAWQVMSAWTTWLRDVGLVVPPLRPANVAGLLGNPNAVATYVYLLVPYGTWVAWSWWRGRVIAAALVALGAFSLLATGSRGAWVGAAAGLVAWAAVSLAARRGSSQALSGRRWLAVAIAVIVGLVAVTPLVLSRIAEGDTGRLELWSAAVAIFGRSPWLGAGPGSWQGLRPAEAVVIPETASILTPHDSVLYIAAELGVVGLVAALALFVAIVVAALRSFRQGDAARRGELAVVAGSLIALLIHAAFDPQFMVAGVMVLSLYLVARLDPLTEAVALRPARVALAGATVVVVTCLVVLLRIDSAMLDASAGVRALERADWAAGRSAYEQAIAVHDLGAYELGLAIAASRSGDLDAAVQALERQGHLDRFTMPDASRATLLEVRDPTGALAAATAVAEASHYDRTALLNAAGVLDRAADPRAVDLVADALAMAPPIDLRPMPTGPVSAETWRAGLERAVASVALTDPLAAADLAHEAGDRDRAATIAAMATAGPERDLFALYLAAGRQEAVDLGAARQHVLDSRTERSIRWYARLARLKGAPDDIARAIVMGQQLYHVDPLEALVVDVTGDPSDTLVERLQSYPGAFHRSGPARPYVSGVTTLAKVPWHP